MTAVKTRDEYRTIDVRDFGAVGDGSTNDTSAIQAALDAVPAAGARVVFPPGIYSVPSGGLSCANPVTIEGRGGAATDVLTPYWSDGISQINVSSGTATALTLTGSGTTISHLSLRCTGTPAATGVGVSIGSGGGNGNRYVGLTIRGFYINMDHKYGTEWFATDCLFYDYGLYGMKVQNLDETDGGDMGIHNCLFYGGPTNVNADAGLRWESGGGIRIVGCKFNHRGAVANYPDHCIDFAINDGVATGEAYIVGNGISAATTAALRFRNNGTTGTFSGITVVGNLIVPLVTTSYPILIDPPSTGLIADVVITGNTIRNATNSSVYPISITNLARMAVSGNVYTGTIAGAAMSVGTGCTDISVAYGDRAARGPASDQPAVARIGPGSGYFNTDLAVYEYADPNVIGVWRRPRTSRRGTTTYSASVTPNANNGDWTTITVSDGNAFTINAPTNPPSSSYTQELTIEISNASGGAMGAITWNAAFKLVGGAFTNPANGSKRFVVFEWNGSSWVETSRAGADY